MLKPHIFYPRANLLKYWVFDTKAEYTIIGATCKSNGQLPTVDLQTVYCRTMSQKYFLSLLFEYFHTIKMILRIESITNGMGLRY